MKCPNCGLNGRDHMTIIHTNRGDIVKTTLECRKIAQLKKRVMELKDRTGDADKLENAEAALRKIAHDKPFGRSFENRYEALKDMALSALKGEKQ